MILGEQRGERHSHLHDGNSSRPWKPSKCLGKFRKMHNSMARHRISSLRSLKLPKEKTDPLMRYGGEWIWKAGSSEILPALEPGFKLSGLGPNAFKPTHKATWAFRHGFGAEGHKGCCHSNPITWGALLKSPHLTGGPDNWELGWGGGRISLFLTSSSSESDVWPRTGSHWIKPIRENHLAQVRD